MTRDKFLGELRTRLNGIPRDDIDDRIAFYKEIIDDKIDEGYSETEAVADIGTVDEIVDDILMEMSFVKLAKEKIKRNGKSGRKLEAWEIILLIIGAPLWFPLLVSAVAVIFSLYIVLWSVIISIWAVFVSFVACSPMALVMSAVSFVGGNIVLGFIFIGVALLCAGVGILLFFGARSATKGAILLMKKIVFAIKKLFVRGGTDNE